MLLAIISQAGAVLVRHGRNHDIYKNPHTGAQEPIARHNDIPERTAKKIIKNLS
jgi:predicted RNA binding protein YcfA (HicA-like mRNA interferase family)